MVKQLHRIYFNNKILKKKNILSSMCSLLKFMFAVYIFSHRFIIDVMSVYMMAPRWTMTSQPNTGFLFERYSWMFFFSRLGFLNCARTKEKYLAIDSIANIATINIFIQHPNRYIHFRSWKSQKTKIARV